MPAEKRSGLSARRVGITLALTAVAGFVDVFGYVNLSHVYTATASGNTVSIAVHTASGQRAAAQVFGFTVAMFLAGLLVSGIAIELGLRRGRRRILSVALAIEATCLGAFAYWGSPLIDGRLLGTTEAPHRQLFLLLALAAMAMGIQNTSLRMAGVVTAFTTHVTGALTRFSEQLIDYGFGLASRPVPGRPAPSLGRVLFSAGIWLAFLAGGGAASVLTQRWSARIVLLAPIAVLLLVALIDLIQPFAQPRR